MTKEIEGKDLIEVLNQNDVLCGRGSGPNDHRGNVKFRNLVYERRAEYLASTTRKAKGQIAQDIVDYVRTGLNPPGRFLKKIEAKTAKSLGISRGADVWVEVDDDTALEKAKQALRQNRDYSTNPKGNENNDSSKNKSNSERTIINDMTANDLLHQYSVPCSVPSHNPEYHQMMQAPNFQSMEHPYMSHQPPNFNGHYQTPPFLNPSLPHGQNMHPSLSLGNTNLGGPLQWPNGNHQQMHHHEERFHQPTFGNNNHATPNHKLPRSVVIPDSVDSADYAAMALANMVVASKDDDDDDNQNSFNKRKKKDTQSGKNGEMLVSDSDSSKMGARYSKSNEGSAELHSSIGSGTLFSEHNQATFQTSDSSPLTFEDYQVIQKDGKEEEYRDHSGSVSTMGTIDIPHRYLMQLPQSFNSSLKSTDGKGRVFSFGTTATSEKKSSGVSVKSGVSTASAMFSEMSVSISDFSHDMSLKNVAQHNKSFTDSDNHDNKVVDTSAIENNFGRKKTSGQKITTPRTWEMMEDDPDELSSLGQASLTILNAAMDASVCSGTSNLSSNFDSIEEGEESVYAERVKKENNDSSN